MWEKYKKLSIDIKLNTQYFIIVITYANNDKLQKSKKKKIIVILLIVRYLRLRSSLTKKRKCALAAIYKSQKISYWHYVGY